MLSKHLKSKSLHICKLAKEEYQTGNDEDGRDSSCISVNERIISVNERIIYVNERIIFVNERIISVNERIVQSHLIVLGDVSRTHCNHDCLS